MMEAVAWKSASASCTNAIRLALPLYPFRAVPTRWELRERGSIIMQPCNFVALDCRVQCSIKYASSLQQARSS